MALLVYDRTTGARVLRTVVDRPRTMKARILVIDDEPAIRDTMRMILEYAGHEMIGAGSGPEGLALVEREPPGPRLPRHQDARAWTASRC